LDSGRGATVRVHDSPQLADALLQLSFLLDNTVARIAAEHDLSVIHVRLLRVLRDREPGMFELAQQLELKKSTLSGLVNRSERRGLVERTASPDDGRAARLRVTAEGRKISRVIDERVNAEMEKLAAVLPRTERDRLARVVSQLVTGGVRRLATDPAGA
jgi:MarR family transcriptional regulator, lower aerobic nicotinate degradation pathway regulator